MKERRSWIRISHRYIFNKINKLTFVNRKTQIIIRYESPCQIKNLQFEQNKKFHENNNN